MFRSVFFEHGNSMLSTCNCLLVLLGEALYDFDWFANETDGVVFGGVARDMEVSMRFGLGMDGLTEGVAAFDNAGRFPEVRYKWSR